MRCKVAVKVLLLSSSSSSSSTIQQYRLYSLPEPPQLPRSVLQDLLQFATKKSHFIFDGQYYDQIDGVAMVSPLGPVLANIFIFRFCPSL